MTVVDTAQRMKQDCIRVVDDGLDMEGNGIVKDTVKKVMAGISEVDYDAMFGSEKETPLLPDLM